MQKTLRILSYFRPDAWRIALSLLLILLSTLLALLWGFPLAILIDSFSGQKQEQWLYLIFYNLTPQESPIAKILFLAGLMLVIRVGSELLRMWQSILSIRVGLHGMMRVRCDLYRKLQTLSAAYHRSAPQGDAIYRVAWDTYGFQGILNVLVTILVSTCKLVLMVAIAWSFNWQITLMALLAAPPLLLIFHFYGKTLRLRSVEAKEKDSGFYTVLQRSMSAIGLVQAYNRQSDEYRHFDKTVHNSARAYYNLHWHEVMYWLLIGVVFAFGATLVFGYGGYLVSTGALTLGTLTIILAYIADLYDPLSRLSSSGSGWISAMVGVNRVFEVLDRKEPIQDAPNAIDLPRKPRTLFFHEVGFSYQAQIPVLQDVSMTIPPGSMVAIVGASGTGKTTLLNLLPRFYDPTAGGIVLDQNDIRTITLASLRRHIALVHQENIILPTTIAENIAYGRPDATQQQIEHAAESAGAREFIEKMPEKWESQVAENGGNLSGGQRQRIAIARALLTEAPILVLDEPTSALDAEHERLITQTLMNLIRSRTIIIVSHRLSTVMGCDRIYVMEGGKIVEEGDHARLVSQDGPYRRMARHQLGVD